MGKAKKRASETVNIKGRISQLWQYHLLFSLLASDRRGEGGGVFKRCLAKVQELVREGGVSDGRSGRGFTIFLLKHCFIMSTVNASTLPTGL